MAGVRRERYAKDGWFVFFERMHALRPFENVLMDLYDDALEINRLADMLVEYEMEELRLMCAAGVDGVQFGDDFGTPDDVKRAVHTAAEAFDVKNGGAFFYVETDNGFPLENIRALLETIGEYRTGEMKWDEERILTAQCGMKNRKTC